MIHETTLASFRKPNTPVSYMNLRGRLFPVDDDLVVIKFDSNNVDPIILSEYQLEDAYGTELHFIRDKKTLPDNTFRLTNKIKTEIFRKNAYLDALYEICGKRSVIGGKVRRQEAVTLGAKRLNDLNPPSIATLANWAATERDIEGGVSADTAQDKKNKRKSKFSEEVQYAAIVHADEHFFGKFISIQSFYDSFIDTYKDTFDELPCYEGMRQWLIKIIDPKKNLKNCNRAERKRVLRNAIKSFSTFKPLERVEADAASLRVGIVDEQGNYLGQATAIFFLDVGSRSVLGYEVHIGKGEPASSVISAYRHAICTKPEGSHFSVNNKRWYCYGIPVKLVFDGGPGFISGETHTYITKTSGITVETVASNSPWLKPFVERFIYTFRLQCERELPGYVGKVEDQSKLDHKIEQRACLTIDALRRIIESWITDDYHHSSHSGINGKTPYQAWKDGLKNYAVRPETPMDKYKVGLPMGKRKFATILGDCSHQGVQINRIKYNDHEGKLKQIGTFLKSQNKKAQVECLFSECDIFSITVIDPDSRVEFRVNTTDERIKPGTSLVEYYALNPSTYSNKGYKNSRTVKKHPDLLHGKSVEGNVLAKPNKTQLRRMDLNDYQKRSDNFDAGNDTTSDQSPYPTSEDFSDVNPLPQS